MGHERKLVACTARVYRDHDKKPSCFDDTETVQAVAFLGDGDYLLLLFAVVDGAVINPKDVFSFDLHYEQGTTCLYSIES